MATIAIIISIIALVGAGFAFLRASSSHRILVKRIETLKEKNARLEERLRKVEGNSSRGNRPSGDAQESGRRNQAASEANESGRRNQSRQEQQQERQESRQRQKERQPQQERQGQQQERQQQERQPQERRHQERQSQDNRQQQQELVQGEQPRRKKENRRRNEPAMDTNKYDQVGGEQQPVSKPVNLEFASGDLLDELEQAAGYTTQAPAPEPVADSGKRYAIIPEDGVIRMHQLQQRPDSDSYIEVDVPADGSSMTGYRFNLSGNHAFVISQGIDRLENAFAFEKPSNRMVSRVVLQGDGVLTKVNNGWRIQEKARIDFR